MVSGSTTCQMEREVICIARDPSTLPCLDSIDALPMLTVIPVRNNGFGNRRGTRSILGDKRTTQVI